MKPKHRLLALLATIAPLLVSPVSAASPPEIINYQGRVAVDNVNFDGTASFKFALVDDPGTTTLWSNDGTSTTGNEPTAAVSLTVTKGLYALGLGDTALANMTAVPASVFTDNTIVKLRVWFDDGTNGSVLLSPDQTIASSKFSPAHTTGDLAATNPLFPALQSSPPLAMGKFFFGERNFRPINAP